jgi:FkbM family methyltransferase
LRAYKLHILKDEFTVEVTRWFRDKGDETLRLDYPELSEESIVFDLGGYKGDFAYAINEKYGCTVYVFEPHPKYFDACIKRFFSNDKVVPFNYGLSEKDGKFLLSDSVDGSSFLNPNHQDKNTIECEVKEIFSVLRELEISNINLMKINIEGGEYPLLLHMISEDKLSLVDNYQIQFHNFIENADSLRSKIIKGFLKTHVQTWCYTFVWENWKRK